MKSIFILTLAYSLFSISVFANEDYCLAHTDRDETAVTCSGNDHINDFKVGHTFPFSFSFTFKGGAELQAIKDVAILEVEERLSMRGYISRGRFGDYTLFQREVGSLKEQKNMILVKSELNYSFIKEGGWVLDMHTRDEGERDNFVNRIIQSENLVLETYIAIDPYNLYSGAEIVIYKQNN